MYFLMSTLISIALVVVSAYPGTLGASRLKHRKGGEKEDRKKHRHAWLPM